MRLRGSLGFDKVTERDEVKVEVKAKGVWTVRLLRIGACIPKRGSGPCTCVVLVPSGAVMVRLPLDVTKVVVSSQSRLEVYRVPCKEEIIFF